MASSRSISFPITFSLLVENFRVFSDLTERLDYFVFPFLLRIEIFNNLYRVAQNKPNGGLIH